MRPPTPSVRAMSTPLIVQQLLADYAACRALAQEVCQEAAATRARAAEIRQVSFHYCQRARALRTVSAEHLAAGVRRRQKGLAQP